MLKNGRLEFLEPELKQLKTLFGQDFNKDNKIFQVIIQ